MKTFSGQTGQPSSILISPHPAMLAVERLAPNNCSDLQNTAYQLGTTRQRSSNFVPSRYCWLNFGFPLLELVTRTEYCFVSFSEEGMFPYDITPLDPVLNKQLMDHFHGERTGFCQVGPDQVVLPARYAQQAEGYYNLPLRQDDIFIATFPRSGTTWCQEMVWLINNNYDYEQSAEIPLNTRFPFLEFGIIHHPKLHEDVLQLNDNDSEVDRVLTELRTPGYEWAEDLPSPRHMKTHLPFNFLPPDLLNTSKVIYLARNPLDVAVSYYHHNRFLKVHDYKGDFETYWNYFQDGHVVYGPYWSHVLQAWNLRKHPNMLFLFYEDLLQNLPKNIKRICDFMNKSITDEQMNKLVNHLHIDNFRVAVSLLDRVELKGMVNELEQGFIRKGGKGGALEEFSEELRARADKWVSENLSQTDLRFPPK